MSDLTTRLNAAADQTETDSGLLNSIVNGAVDETVWVDDGTIEVPTVANAINQILEVPNSKANIEGDNITSPTTWKTNLSLENVDNTSDADKPVSTAQAAAIADVQADVDDLSSTAIIIDTDIISQSEAEDAVLKVHNETLASGSITTTDGSGFSQLAWGGVVADGDSKLVTLPTTLSDGDYRVILYNDDGTALASCDYYIYSRTATTFRVMTAKPATYKYEVILS